MGAGSNRFHGWRVVGAAFVLAVFGWGLGFYGPPVYLHAVREAKNFSLPLVSTAVTVHFVIGATGLTWLESIFRQSGYRFAVENATKRRLRARSNARTGSTIGESALASDDAENLSSLA